MAEPIATAPEVVVLADIERILVTGRVAAIIGLVAAHAERIIAMPVGKLVANIGSSWSW